MNILELCRIAPSDAAAELQLPLTFLDMFWPDYYPIRRLLFYEFPCSKSDFVERIIPSDGMPEIQFKSGDSVTVFFAESEDDFSYLIGNQPRIAAKFYPLLPDLPPVVHDCDSRLIPLLAVQVTLFPNVGVSVGLINQHVIGDARTTVNFIKSWATICRSGGDDEFGANKSLHPVFDRGLIKDPSGKLLTRNWNYLRRAVSRGSPVRVSVEDKVRATFMMEDANVQKLKNRAAMAMGIESTRHVSTFTVICGYVWSCLAKSSAAIGEEDGIDHFFFPADYRIRLDPPLPANYFGNCLGFFFVKLPRSHLIANDGFLVAEKLIGQAIYRRFCTNKEEIMKSAEDWADQFEALDWDRTLATAGSPRFDVYDADFGWGKPKKFEPVAIDSSRFVSLCKSRDSDRNMEIGLCLPKVKMDAFAAIFNGGL